jgi:hypothetical protein
VIEVKKLAIFVEGLTELVFVDKLLRELITDKKLCIEHFHGYGGKKSARRLITLQATASTPNHIYYVQIIVSAADNRVASDIKDNYEGLVRSGFDAIIGIRDVYPDFASADVEKLRAGLRYGLRTKPIMVVLVLGIMEIEAWFLAEHTHFPKVHSGLTIDRIWSSLHFNPSTEDMQLRNCPHGDLHNIYTIEGLAYRKEKHQIQRTVSVLDYGRIYIELLNKFPDLKKLMASLDNFFD